MLEFSIGEALLEFAIDDGFHAVIGLLTLDTLLSVRVDALMDEGLHVLALDHDVELLSSDKSQSQSVIILFKVEEYF